MNDKTKSLVSKIVNIVCIVLLAIVLLLTISIIASSGKGYTAIFGKVYFKVETDSMNGEYGQNGGYSDTWEFEKKGFNVGEIIVVDVLNDAEKVELKVGDVITFKMADGSLNTHRIVQINGTGNSKTFSTQGDNTLGRDGVELSFSDIIGKWTGSKNGAFAWFFNSINTKVGYILIVVVPTSLILIYCVYLVIRGVISKNSDKLNLEKSKLEEKYEMEKEKMRQELLKELSQNNSSNANNANEITDTNNATDTIDKTTADAEKLAEINTDGENKVNN